MNISIISNRMFQKEAADGLAATLPDQRESDLLARKKEDAKELTACLHVLKGAHGTFLEMFNEITEATFSPSLPKLKRNRELAENACKEIFDGKDCIDWSSDIRGIVEIFDRAIAAQDGSQVLILNELSNEVGKQCDRYRIHQEVLEKNLKEKEESIDVPQREANYEELERLSLQSRYSEFISSILRDRKEQQLQNLKGA